MAFKAGEYDSFIGLTSHGVSRHCLPVIVSTLAYCLVLQQLYVVTSLHSGCFQRSNWLPMHSDLHFGTPLARSSTLAFNTLQALSTPVARNMARL